MFIRQIAVVFVCFISTSLLAKDYPLVSNQVTPQILSNSLIKNPNNSWISAENNLVTGAYSLDDKFTFTWGLSDLLTINFDVFENRFIQNNFAFQISNNLGSNNGFYPNINNYINRSAIGYKIGLSSNLWLGKNYNLGIDLDYGLLGNGGIAGFSQGDINTTSIALGIRKKKFGATFNTDIYVDDRVDFIQTSKIGLEFDWHFSEDTTFSFGTKQLLNDSSSQTNYLDNITGNVQYIKFKHNL